MRIVYLGSGQFGVECLNALSRSDHNLLFIVTQPAQQAGRGRKPRPTPVACWADEHSIPFVETNNVNTSENIGKIAGYEPDILCIQGAKRGEQVNQIAKLANHFGYDWACGTAVAATKDEIVNGILSRYKVSDSRVIDATEDGKVGLLARVAWPSQPIWVVSIALSPTLRVDPIGLTQAEAQRVRQVDRILDVTGKLAAPVIVAGTLNSTPLGGVYRRMASRWTDCHFALDALAPATYPNFIPAFRFDYVFASERFYPTQAQVSAAGPSDHRAVIVYMRLKATDTQPATTAQACPATP